MARSGYGRTDITKKAISEAKRVLEKMKESNPSMSWQERNVVMNEIGKKYENQFLFQTIMFGDSINKWWRKKYGR